MAVDSSAALADPLESILSPAQALGSGRRGARGTAQRPTDRARHRAGVYRARGFEGRPRIAEKLGCLVSAPHAHGQSSKPVDQKIPAMSRMKIGRIEPLKQQRGADWRRDQSSADGTPGGTRPTLPALAGRRSIR